MMCDLIMALPAATAGHVTLFGKNSDRQRNEAQLVELRSSADHAAGTRVNCTYIDVPQVAHTHATLLCRPFWIWGAEMGANEHGVVIGNLAVQARQPAAQEPALLGMDFLRLALERSCSAAEAVEIITSLLDEFGQGGNCGHLTPSFYNNAFAVTDATEAFVLETIGREWLVERVQSVRSMSNRYSIGRGVERTSKSLPALIHSAGWSDEETPCYADAVASTQREHIVNAIPRRERSESLLQDREGRMTVADMLNILRDHGSIDHVPSEWRAERALTLTLCMHAGTLERPGQTVGALVSELSVQHSVHWVTGTSAPCISIFKPVLFGAPLPAHGPQPTDRFDPGTLWWQHERMHRMAVAADFNGFLESIRGERDDIEAQFRTRILQVLSGGDAVDRANVVAACWKDAMEMEAEWAARIPASSRTERSAYLDGWAHMNALAGLNHTVATGSQTGVGECN